MKKKTLKQSISKVLSEYYPYSKDEIYNQLRRRNGVDLIIHALDNSLKYAISLQKACDDLREKRNNEY